MSMKIPYKRQQTKCKRIDNDVSAGRAAARAGKITTVLKVCESSQEDSVW